MRCRGTVVLGALRAQSGGPVQNELTLHEMVNGISAGRSGFVYARYSATELNVANDMFSDVKISRNE